MMSHITAAAVTVLAVAWTFAPTRTFDLLNWDDDAVIVRNTALDGPGVVQWAFGTTYMEHYQPLSWLVWAGIKQSAGVSPSAFHTANVLAHVACSLLVFASARALLRRWSRGAPATRHDVAALGAALIYAIHPLRVEVVAWISAFPYALALAFTLLSLLAWLRTTAGAARSWWIGALLLYVASLLARPVALGFPIVLVVIDRAVLGRGFRASVARVWPFALAATASGLAEGFARASALNNVPWLYSLQSVALAPFVYVWRTLVPLRLTPLDLLPEQPSVNPLAAGAALMGLALLAAAAWRWRDRWPSFGAILVAYLALLAPAAGFVMSGLQQTADRYTYLPGVVLAVAVAGAGVRWAGRHVSRQWLVAGAAALVIATAAAATRQALASWSDSVTLWTRTAALDPTNHLALYNLGNALAAAGQTDDAAAQYRQVLALQPAHAQARANLDRLEAARFEREGNEAAARGDLRAAAQSYASAIARDAQRTHAQAGLGMALAAQGRSSEALAPLREAVRQGLDDTAVANTLAVLLREAGDVREARVVLESALAAHQNDVGLAHNLARLLATDPVFMQTDGALALRLARAVVDATGARDPRALDTFAAALAANGRMGEAAETSARAAALASAQGDRDMAVQITARGHAYRNPGQ